MKTIKDLKNELKIFNYELNGFIYTFEVAYLKKQNFIKKRYADSDEIDDFFYEEILKLKPLKFIFWAKRIRISISGSASPGALIPFGK